MNQEITHTLNQTIYQPRIEDSPQHLENLEYSFGNPELPMYARKAEIIETIQNNAITILVAETGAGKSTQLPQFALEAGFDTIFLTQPRRAAADNVASRIRSELGEVLGENRADELVSRQTGAGLVGPPDARIRVVTDGLHLAREGQDTSERPNELWIIDEVHEWNNNLEMLIALGKERRAENPNFKMVVMSATMNKDKLAKYLSDEDGIQPPVIEVSGRMFDVKYKEEPQSTVVKEALKCAKDIFINPDDNKAANTIQIFVEGVQEITDTIDGIRSLLPYEMLQQTTLVPLHSLLTPAAQAPAYEDMSGIKIIVQTKMGQTSVTVPRTRYVISSGMERRIELNDEDAPGLLLRPISQDDIDQQMGRTGRTCEGTFILTRLNERVNFISRASREKHQSPEISRTLIDRLTLMRAADDKDISDLDSYHVIAPASIDRSKRRVRALGGLDENNEITSLGRRMNAYPLSLPSARSMIEAERHPGLIRTYMAAIAASKEAGGLRLFNQTTKDTRRWESLTDDASSDALAQLDIFIAIQDMPLEETHDYDLDTNKIIRAREYYNKVAKRAGGDPYKRLPSPTAEERMILRECIAAGLINTVYLPVGEGLYRLLGDSAILREVSNRSVTQGTPMAIVGDPRQVQVFRNGKPEIKNIIEDVTEVAMADIGRVAAQLTRWKPTGFTMRGGKFMQSEQQTVGSVVIGSRETLAEPSPLLRSAIIEHVKVSPGPHLTELYRIKRALEKLDMKAKVPIRRLTEGMILDYIEQAAPDDVTDISLIENNLRLLIEEKGISYGAFVSPDEEAEIVRNAPPAITVSDVSFGLRYVTGEKRKPVVKKYTVEMIQRLGDDIDSIRLADNREVYFYYDEKPHTLRQLRKKLQDADLL